MERTALYRMREWKERPRRKPLLLTGVRQCGKTWLLQEFGRQDFERTLLFNFEREPALADIFRYDLDPARILHELGMYRDGRPIDTEHTLIVFDEIQHCSEAVTSLKYFCESGLNLYLACAGSLLGVELKRKGVSFPVGKVERLQMYPLDFYEFVTALGGEKYLAMIKSYDRFRELPTYVTEPMLRYLKLYFIVGGMPGAVQTYLDSGEMGAVDKVLDDIIADFRDDFAHHAEPKDIMRIGWIWDSIPKQLAKENNKFVFSHVRQGSRARDLEDALQWLCDAGLVYRLEKVSAPQIPLSACADATFFKTYLHDVGILRRSAGLSYHSFLTEPNGFAAFKGAFAENYCMTELRALGIAPYYWNSGASAEVDFIFQDDRLGIVPLETKSADNTKAKSFALFCRKYRPAVGFKVSTKNVGDNQKEDTHEISLPLYALWRLRDYTDQE